jgi:hypothetical protein
MDLWKEAVILLFKAVSQDVTDPRYEPGFSCISGRRAKSSFLFIFSNLISEVHTRRPTYDERYRDTALVELGSLCAL